MPPEDYKVGYGKPPENHRFKKGQSGNPKGRPRDKKADQIDVRNILGSEITIRERGKKRKAFAFEASLQAQVNRALNDGRLADIIDAIRTFEKYDILKSVRPSLKTGVAQVRTHPMLEDVSSAAGAL